MNNEETNKSLEALLNYVVLGKKKNHKKKVVEVCPIIVVYEQILKK